VTTSSFSPIPLTAKSSKSQKRGVAEDIGPKGKEVIGWRKRQNEEFHDLNPSPNSSRLITLKRMRSQAIWGI
jgi:hypothetical protein